MIVVLCRETAGLTGVLSASPGYGFDENTQPNSRSVLIPDTEDAKSERIRQLHLTLGALIDERDELQDTLSISASPELAQQLQRAQAELQVLRRCASSHTSGRNSLADEVC